MATTTPPARKVVEVVLTRAVEDGSEEIVPGPRVRPPPWGWLITEHAATGQQHVIPTWDIGNHYYALDCECVPVLDDAGTIHHNSFDGRERYEQGAPLN